MYRYRVKKVEHITPSTLLVDLERPTAGKIIAFLPGQYAAISFYRKHRPTPARCFSIVTSPTDTDRLQFSMRSKGHFTKAIAGLKEGDTVKVRGPYGGFVLDLANGGDVVLLAGGIGITPFMSMVSYAAKVKLNSKITLVYSVQNQDDVPFIKELKELQKENKNLKLHFVVGEGPVDKIGEHITSKGFITPELLDEVSNNDYSSITYFMCGPPPFMRAMAKNLKAKGVDKNRIITEAFAQGSQRQTGKIRSWPNNIYALSAISVVVGSFIVMVSDLLKTLPPSTIKKIANSNPLLTNSRQQDLDSLVNKLPPNTNNAPDSNAVVAANKAAKKASQTTTTATTSSSSSTTSSTTTKSSSSTSTSSTTSSPTPTCTTTQSGVTTCI